ncbi:MAG TPA: OmpA family protein [Acidobacteriaceae bacterium]|nr:OmpA family protein [Acidobacteriaceae bacterium]
MKELCFIFVATTTLLAIPSFSEAAAIEGPYVGAAVGPNFTIRPETTLTAPGLAPVHRNLVENTGFAGVLSLGYGFGNGFRAEIEGNYRQNSIRQLQSTPFPSSVDGNVRKFGPMFNVFYDVDLLPKLPYALAPYVGLGAGYIWTNVNRLSVVQPVGDTVINQSGTAGKFAWQAIVGMEAPLPFSGLQGITFTVEYRFLDITSGGKIDGTQSIGGVTVPSTLKLHKQFDHTLLFGVRYAFLQPGPPPPPAPAPVAAPAPQPSRSYLVFFDWDRADLTDRARQIIREAADNSTRVQYTRIEVNGYTDTSGAPEYNQRLSVRRAEAVASELVRDGVPRSAISIQGFGETHLLVPTGDGVREPQNRRVEIVVR